MIKYATYHHPIIYCGIKFYNNYLKIISTTFFMNLILQNVYNQDHVNKHLLLDFIM